MTQTSKRTQINLSILMVEAGFGWDFEINTKESFS
jgi:hypothetical protein